MRAVLGTLLIRWNFSHKYVPILTYSIIILSCMVQKLHTTLIPSNKRWIPDLSTASDRIRSRIQSEVQEAKILSAERWVCTLRQECLNDLLIINEAHLRNVLNEFIEYYNSRRSHQGLNQQSPFIGQRSNQKVKSRNDKC